ncbi:MAG: type II toxin-antitoxin system RelE/ParE family toxin [Ignavibacteriales bacterium]|nr:MAG: type II toxin-antitoxin system RelE/ParE family toxin [Ignavibacteriales bacterium]
MFEVRLSKAAKKNFNKLNEPYKSKVKNSLIKLCNFPDVQEVKAMKGNFTGYYRLRVGDIRVLFFVEKKHNLILVDSIDFRGSVYK